MRIYFMSICGTGMGNGALLMKALGHEILGADQNTYPPMSDRLSDAGIDILPGYDAARLKELDPDLVVIGNVNTRGNAEVEWLLDTRSIPFVSLPQLLAGELLQKRRTIVISGTHGKTTTTTMTACLMKASGSDAGYLIGGVPNDLATGAHAGGDEAPFVIEGDEYDSAFFDKRSKFIHYCPNILVINNLEYDHADIFRDLADVKRTFHHLVKLVPRSGFILANSDDPEVEELLHVDWTTVYRVGLGDRADLRIADYSESMEGSAFSLIFKDRLWARVQWRQWGLFNARNAAMAALAAALGTGCQDPLDFNLDALATFNGVKLRQEILAHQPRITVLRDFAHHPTAVSEILRSLRNRYPGRHLMLGFEPRSNTACRKVHETAFELAFDEADEIHLGAVFRTERYSDSDRIDLPGMAKRLGEKAVAHASNASLETALGERLREVENAVLVFFSNGSFDGIPQRVARRVMEL